MDFSCKTTEMYLMQAETTQEKPKSLADRIEGTGEFLFTVFMMMLAAAGRALSGLFTAIGRRLAWLGDKVLVFLRWLGEKIRAPFNRYIKAFNMGRSDIRSAREKGVVPALSLIHIPSPRD